MASRGPPPRYIVRAMFTTITVRGCGLASRTHHRLADSPVSWRRRRLSSFQVRHKCPADVFHQTFGPQLLLLIITIPLLLLRV